MPLRLATPLVLVALLVVPAIVAATWRRARTDRHLRIATWLRAVGVAALVVALAGPTWDVAGRDLDLVVVVDASDSTAAARARATRRSMR